MDWQTNNQPGTGNSQCPRQDGPQEKSCKNDPALEGEYVVGGIVVVWSVGLDFC